MSRTDRPRGQARGAGPGDAPDRGAAPHRGAGRRRWWWFALSAGLAAAVLAGGLSALALRPGSGPAEPKALIVDQLDATFPNEAFVDDTARLLLAAGYRVDYAPAEEVGVDFYRQLADHSYDLIILRAHVARLGDRGTQTLGDDAIIFTSELYAKDKHIEDQREGHLAFAHTYSGGDLYFALMPDFIRDAMKGDFDGATIILMGCDGLRSDAAASAFIARGAGAVIGWDGPVSADHTDSATKRLVEHLLAERHDAAQSLAMTSAEVGPDPAFGGQLRLYTNPAD